MNNIKQLLVCLTILFVGNFVHAQSKPIHYNIGDIPKLDEFEKMTTVEVDLDTSKFNIDHHLLLMMIDGSAFLENVSKEEKEDAINYQKIIESQRYKDNRSRYFLDLYVNGNLDNSRFEKLDTLTSECDAYLSDGTIRIGTGIWGMGGFSFMLDINKSNYTSAYWEDANKSIIYKRSLNDKDWDDNVLVDMANQSLTLKYQPKFVVGEEIVGYLTFTTEDYYKISDSETLDKNKSFDVLRLSGVVYFKCKVREKKIGNDD